MAGDQAEPLLRTWKEISAYLGVAVRTAQYWEREKGLPVKRLSGNKAQVWAARGELDLWRAQQEQLSAQATEDVQDDNRNDTSTGNTTQGATQDSRTPADRNVNMHTEHLALCCLLYSGLYVLDFFLEITYEWEHFAKFAALAAPVLGIWIAGTSGLGLWLHRLIIRKSVKVAFTVMWSIYASAGLLAWLGLCSILPPFPVTLLSFRAQTAQAAFLKNVILYFFPLVTLALLVPYHFIASRHTVARGWKTPQLLRPPFLASVVLLEGIVSVFLTQDLLRNLVPGPHMNMFMIIAITKSFVYFLFGCLSIAWYVRTLEYPRRRFDTELKDFSMK